MECFQSLSAINSKSSQCSRRAFWNWQGTHHFRFKFWTWNYNLRTQRVHLTQRKRVQKLINIRSWPASSRRCAVHQEVRALVSQCFLSRWCSLTSVVCWQHSQQPSSETLGARCIEFVIHEMPLWKERHYFKSLTHHRGDLSVCLFPIVEWWHNLVSQE